MPVSFLQSEAWEAFQRHLGRKTRRIERVLCIRHDLPGGFHYLYCPRPDFERGNPEVFFQKATRAAREEQSIFIKIDPLRSFPAPGASVLGASLQPSESVVADCSLAVEEMLGRMHEKTRYNIRLARRRGVFCERAEGKDDTEVFWRMLQETAIRDGFHVHEKRHYADLLNTHSEHFSNELFFARIGHIPVAAAMINFYRPSGTATYLHGASVRAYREMMAPHLLHWHIMQEAKRRGFGAYDFWGIDRRRWPGLTRFKEGFGGNIMKYPASIDVVCRPLWYRAYRIARKMAWDHL